MNKLNSLKDLYFDKDDNTKEQQTNKKLEKVLCNHCGRTKNNGVRCLGICVADNEY
tara:strand:+ start:1540 stop:1707 length:168 start_codon:yes stop_codon:yes gene_type:complete